MSGETVIVTGTRKVLEANGGSITNNSIAQANDASYDAGTAASAGDGSGYPDAEFDASFTFSVAPTEGTVIALYARPLAVDGTSTHDTEAPETTRPTEYIGSFVVNNVTTLQYARLRARDVPKKCDYYMHNNGTGQTISAGWTLAVTPISYKAAP